MNKHQERIMRDLSKKHNGTYFKISYIKDCASEIASAHKMHTVIKCVEMSVRKGIEYKNTKAYKQKLQQQQMMGTIIKPRKSWYTHINKVLLKHNSKDALYVALYPNPLTKPKTHYMVDGIFKTSQELKEMGIMRPSYWSEKERPIMLTIELNKIISVF